MLIIEKPKQFRIKIQEIGFFTQSSSGILWSFYLVFFEDSKILGCGFGEKSVYGHTAAKSHEGLNESY